MGISSRDYFRDDTTRGGGGWLSDTPTVRGIIVTTAVVFVLQLVVTAPRPASGDPMPGMTWSLIDQWFAMDVDDVLHGQVWRLLSYAFLHSRYDLWHLIFNMLGLWFFGCTLERMYNSREFLAYYLVAAAVAGVGFTLLTLILKTPGGPMVGASGATMAVFMLYGIHYPRQHVWVWFIPIEIRWLLALYIVADLYPLLMVLGGEPMFDGVAHSAHLSGVLFGWLYYRNNWRLEQTWERLSGGLSLRWRRATSGRRLKVYKPAEEEIVDMDAEVDRILAKIHEHGSESLSDRERSLLTRASEKYKRKT